MIKEFLKRLGKVVTNNANGFYCPKCSLLNLNNSTTALLHIMYDKEYHKFKSYIKCSNCRLTTPALESYKEINDIWDDYFIKQEAELFERD